MMDYAKKYEQGFMEMGALGTFIFYAVMIAVVVGIIWMLFSGSKLTEMEQGLTSMSYNIQGLYSAQRSYSGLDNDVIISAHAAPEKLMRGNTLKTPWGGDITVAPGTDTGTFTIEIADIDEENCIKLANYQTNAWLSVEINGSAIAADEMVSGAISACQDSGNTLTYTSR